MKILAIPRSGLKRCLLRFKKPLLASIFTIMIIVGALFNDTLRLASLQFIDQLMLENNLALTKILVSGNRLLSKQEIIEELHHLHELPLSALPLKEAQKRVLANDWVKNASVTRAFPNRIIVKITENRPYAVWENQGKRLVCDEQGSPITDDLERVADLDLPVIIASNLNLRSNPIMNFLKDHTDFAEKVKSIEDVNNRRWDIVLKNGIKIKLPQENWHKALKFLLENQEKIYYSNAAIIDMRLSDKIYIKEAK